MIRLAILSVGLLFLVLPSPVVRAEDGKIKQLMNQSPAPVNAVGYVNPRALQSLMKDAGWLDRIAERVKEYWFVADMDHGSQAPKWEAGYAVLARDVDAKTIADSVGGYVDEVKNREVVFSPNQSYFVPLDEGRLGILRPANRALLAKWLSPTVEDNYSEFLAAVSDQPEQYLSFMLAVELENVFSPVVASQKLESFDSLKANSPKAIGGILASIRGVTIIVGRQSLDECIVKFDFNRSPGGLRLIAAPLLSEILDNNGTSAPEVLSWETKIEGNTLAMKGTITESTLTGLLSIFSVEAQARHVAANSASRPKANAGGDDPFKKPLDLSGGPSESVNRDQQMGYRSKYYFEEVGDIIEMVRKHKSKTIGALGKWNDQRARQIDELNTLNVDPDMIQYGTNVSESLRGNAITVRQGAINAQNIKARQGAAYGSYSGGYYGNGYGYGGRYNGADVTRAQTTTDAVTRGNAYSLYRQMLTNIDSMTAEVRRMMTQKYQIRF